MEFPAAEVRRPGHSADEPDAHALAPAVSLRPAADCAFDALSMGEVLLRLDPGDMRIRTARTFTAWEGGGEYNVARALRKCFRWRTAILTALVDNEVGRLIEDLIWQGGVDTRFLRWRATDAAGRPLRNGLNFTERGFGVRGALGVADRRHSATAAMAPGDLDWEEVFGRTGTRWFHTGGIFAGLSETTAALALDAVRAARAHGVVVSYDLNYRPSLWGGTSGATRAQQVNREIVREVDVLLGNEEDFTAALGFAVAGAGRDYDRLDVPAYAALIADVAAEFPNLSIIAATLRTVTSASVNDWGALAWSAPTGLLAAAHRSGLEILDRVGGGDAFASGLIHGLLAGTGLAGALALGAAHGALVMTTPGDTSMATLAEVEALARGGSARVQR